MPPAPAPVEGALTAWLARQHLILPVALVASVLVILVPLPTVLVDVLLAANITVAVLMLLTTIYVRTPLEFSIFPSLLLVTTLARLVLNVATTRLILTQAGSEGLDAAGEVVKSFGEFVAGDKVVVGLIIFAIIVLIQFLVITKGATRISEVAARFALDGLPGKQMAIDADLNAGIIDHKEAQRRRVEAAQQADFYGAMDGASKFVRGDAIAGLAITAINIVGGLFIGMIESGMSLTDAGVLFTKLSIGDGLVSQVPAFLISLAAGLLTTRSTSSTDLPAEFNKQLFFRPEVLFITGGFLGLLIFTSLPTIPLLVLGGSCIGLAIALQRSERTERESQAREQARPAAKAETKIEDYLAVDPMELEIGVGLIRLADPKRGGDLLERIQRVRESMAAEIGIVLPKVRIRDNVRLAGEQYRFKIADSVVAEGTLLATRLLAVDHGHSAGALEGTQTTEPAFGLAAVWIDPASRSQAESLGYSVVEPADVLATHLTEVIRQHADELLTRDATRHLVDQLKKTLPAVVEDVIPGQLKLGEVQQVLKHLLHEGVPIRNLGHILETLGDHAGRTKEPWRLAEQVRQRLARAISHRFRDASGCLRAITLDPMLEDRLLAGLEIHEAGPSLRLSPALRRTVCYRLASESRRLAELGQGAVVLAGPEIRAALRRLIEAELPRLAVLSFDEITRDTRVESVALIAAPEAAAVA